MIGGSGIAALPKERLWQDYYANLTTALKSMRNAFKARKQDGLTQDDIASKLRIDKSLYRHKYICRLYIYI